MDTIKELNLLKKGKKKFLKLIYGRTMLILLLMAFQVSTVVLFYYILSQYTQYFYGAMFVVTAGTVLEIFNSRYDDSVKMSWILVVTALAPFGSIFYLYVRNDVGHRKLKKRMSTVIDQASSAIVPDKEVLHELQQEKPELNSLAKYLLSAGGYPPYRNSTMAYFSSGEEMLEELLAQLSQAREFIFIEYFIIEEGHMWGKVLKILSDKAAEGVEVRLIYDGTNEFKNLPHSYPKELAKLGIQSKIFAPIHPFFSTEYNYRDHRKILVIDGHTAFTGGVNLADEYINVKKLYGHWKDTAVMLKGDGVASFTRMFLEAWHIDEEKMNFQKYLKAPTHGEKDAEGYVIPYGDCPLDDDKVGETVYTDIFNNARSYVHVMTPYLILDGEMRNTIQYAARRGVDVKIILPHIPDKKYAFVLAKSHYKELMESGVKIYEYIPGFVHAKVFTSDDHKAVVGSINLDYRSFYHHFECAVYMEDVPEVDVIEEDFQRTLKQCHCVTTEDIRNEKLTTKMGGAIMKLVAPLL